jgi:acetyl coenzyme A synthetase (ADP forming)-like protein
MSLDCFFNPKSVAIIGASRDSKKPGHVIFRNFLEGKFKGKVFPINPSAKEILDHKCYKKVTDIKEKIDLAVIVVPAPIVPKILEDCGKKKIKGAIIISGGFKEVGNVALENKVEDIAKKYKIRVVGTNCIGVFDPYSGVDTIFNPSYKLERPKEGEIAFISQSGAVMSVIMDWMGAKGYRTSKFVSYGNATDVDEADLIEYMGKDKKTKVICVYIEGVKEGRKFYEIAKKVSKKKPIIVIKAGITEEGGKSVSSHTGSLAGQIEAYRAAFKQSGVIEADDIEQVFDYARVLAKQPLPKGDKVQIITDGGGFGVLATDFVIKNGLKMAKMKKENLDKMKKIFPKHVVVGNPIDLTGDATSEMYKIAIDAAIKDDNVDMIIVIALFQTPQLTPEVTEVIIEASRNKKKPMVVISAGGEFTEVLKKTLEDSGVPCFSYPDRAILALKAIHTYAKAKGFV